ncbi:MAG TPA: collagen-binding domain-containing protein [Sedimentisphaerales bacterium]|nr:collagen-binding domain-containing protein [Sedimentisphaerales bacterium]
MACKGSSNSVVIKPIRRLLAGRGADRAKAARRRGSAIVLIVLVVVILSSLGVGLLRLGLSSRIYATRTAHQVEARCAADAGLAKAVFAMNEKLKIKPWSDGTLPAEADQTLPNCDATFDYTVSVDGGNYTVESVGSLAEALKSVNGILRLKGLFESAILTQGPLILKPGMLVDGYNSSDPYDTDVDVKIATTSTAADQIILNSGVVVNGDVFVGMDADPSTVIKDLGATTGHQSSLTEEIEFPAVTLPGYTSPDTTIEAKGVRLPIHPADSGRYSGISLKRTSDPGILEITGGDVVLHVTGNIGMGQDCEIIIDDGSSLTLYVDGDISADNNAGFNNATQIPGNLKIYGTGANQSFDIKAKSDVFGAVYAPNADITIMANGDVYGSVVAKSFEMKAGGNFYYDEALSQVTVDDESVRFVVKRWTEQ